MTLRSRATIAAGLSAALAVLYGTLLRIGSDLQPPAPNANPALAAGLRAMFIVLGVLLAAFYAWRYLAVARAAATGTLELRHRRQLRKMRTTAVWSAAPVTVAIVIFAGRLPAAVPLAITCLLAAVGWAIAAVACVRAERTDAQRSERTQPPEEDEGR